MDITPTPHSPIYGAQADADYNKRISCLLILTCIGFLAAVLCLVAVFFFDINELGIVHDCGFNINTNFPDINTDSGEEPLPIEGYVLDGPTWHTIFYRFANESGTHVAEEYCHDFKKGFLTIVGPVSMHCGLQNSIEQVSFGEHGIENQDVAERSLEYGFAFTFDSEEVKNGVVQNNQIYLSFREDLDEFRDETSFSTQDYRGIWIFDWTHGITKRSNMRAFDSTKYVKRGSTWHFVFFRFKSDEYTYEVTPTIIDNYRDLENTMVSPSDSSKKLASLFSYGAQSSLENLAFGAHTGVNITRSTEYGHVQSYDSFDDKEFMVGFDHVARPVFDKHHDLFKEMIGNLHPGNGRTPFFFGMDELSDNDLEGVFVFDFTDELV